MIVPVFVPRCNSPSMDHGQCVTSPAWLAAAKEHGETRRLTRCRGRISRRVAETEALARPREELQGFSRPASQYARRVQAWRSRRWEHRRDCARNGTHGQRGEEWQARLRSSGPVQSEARAAPHHLLQSLSRLAHHRHSYQPQLPRR